MESIESPPAEIASLRCPLLAAAAAPLAICRPSQIRCVGLGDLRWVVTAIGGTAARSLLADA